MAEFRQLRAIISSAESGRDGHVSQLALFSDHLFGIVQALPALRPLAECRVTRFRIAGDATGDAPKLAFPYGIADADVHAFAPAIDSQEQM